MIIISAIGSLPFKKIMQSSPIETTKWMQIKNDNSCEVLISCLINHYPKSATTNAGYVISKCFWTRNLSELVVFLPCLNHLVSILLPLERLLLKCASLWNLTIITGSYWYYYYMQLLILKVLIASFNGKGDIKRVKSFIIEK